MPIFNANNLAGTELSQSVSTSDTSISVVDASVFPATPFLATIDDNSNIEIVKVTSVSSNTLTVERGKEDTTAQSFDTGVQIEQRFTAGMYENLTNTEESQDAAWSIASGGSNISVGYDDTNDSVSIDFKGTLYSDEDAQDAVGGILNADFNYDDAGNSIALASNSFTVANTTISLGESGTPEADNLAGNNGTSGQVLQTDGSNLSFVDISSFSGDFNDLSNVPELPEGVSLNEYRTWQNQVVSAIAKNQFEVGLTELGYPDGFFDVFVDESKISSKTDVIANTGTNGNVQLDPGISLLDDFEDGLEANWSGDIQTTTQQVLEGTQSGKLKATFKFYIASGTYDLDSTKRNGTFTMKLRIKDQTGVKEDSTFVQGFDADFNQPFKVDFVHNGNITVNGTDTGTNWSTNTTYDLKVVQDFDNTEVEVFLDGTSLGVYTFNDTNASPITDILVEQDSFEHAGTTTCFIDDLRFDEGLATNGSFTSTVQNLGYSASKVTLTADYTLNGQSISAELRTGSGSTIENISESELGDTISISTTATDYNIKWNLDGDGNDTPVLNSYEVALDDGT